MVIGTVHSKTFYCESQSVIFFHAYGNISNEILCECSYICNLGDGRAAKLPS